MRRLLQLLLCVMACSGGFRPARASGPDSLLCQAATHQAELATGTPDQLLDAISRVESGRADPQTGILRAWPWTINAQGVGHFYDSKPQAVAAARAFIDAGIRSIDVGCTQINLMFHPDGFANLDQAFDPDANALFAAHFLTDLFHQTGSWPHAAAAYHSQTPNLGSDYQHKVLDAWADPIDRPGAMAPKRHDTRPQVIYPSQRALAAATAPPFGARPLGGYGHIVRTGPITAPGLGGRGVLPGSLAAYRARPVALLSMRNPPS